MRRQDKDNFNLPPHPRKRLMHTLFASKPDNKSDTLIELRLNRLERDEIAREVA